MEQVEENIQYFRIILLALLVVAIIGPWGYEQIHVPAEYPCSAPFVRLEGDFCGTPQLGITMVFWFVAGFPRVVWEFLAGGINLANLVPSLFPLSFVLLFIFPVLTTFFLLLKGDSRRMRLLHALALVLAAGVLGVWVSLMSGPGNRILWGGQLYIGVIVLLLVLEVLAFAHGRRFSSEI